MIADNMKQGNIGKGLTVAVILLFIGLAIQPSMATEQTEKEIDIEPKDYLFQTIIDIANNPEVKKLLEQYDNDLFSVDIDRSVYRKLFLRNPRLFFNTLFTKPSMSIEYLNKCNNKGIEITDIIGEDKALEIMESVKVTDTEVFDEINNIISKDEILSGRLDILNEMNNEINTFQGWPIICAILNILSIVFYIPMRFFQVFLEIFYDFPILSKIILPFYLTFFLPFGFFYYPYYWFCFIDDPL